MMEKAVATGLGFSVPLSSITGKPDGVQYDSRKGIYKIHRPYIRFIHTNSKVDDSVDARLKQVSTYQPKNNDYFIKKKTG